MAKHNNDGNQAESAVCDYLKSNGFKVIDRNWKTKFCEVDIIAEKSGVTHFVEVKYRSNPEQGSGFDYITPSKLKQMSRAADAWMSFKDNDNEYVLSAAQVSGPDYEIEFIGEII